MLIQKVKTKALSRRCRSFYLKRTGTSCTDDARVKVPSFQSKKDSKDQESIQSSTTPVPGYQWINNKITINTSQEVRPFPVGDHKAAMNKC